MTGTRKTLFTAAALALSLINAAIAPAQTAAETRAYGLSARFVPKAYCECRTVRTARIPALLSQTGAFADTRTLRPAGGLIPYDLVVAFWSDGASKLRWGRVPDEKIKFSPTGEWIFPKGTVFVKTFELATDMAHPGVKRRLETRLLVFDSDGGVYGVLYKWRADNTDADLLGSSRTEEIPVKTAAGEVHNQTWYYPGRSDCLACHNAKTSGALGVKTRQMNRAFTYPTGVTDNQLRAWNHLGLFQPAINDADIANMPTLAAADDPTRGLEDRARSYLDANCAQCHRPGGTVAYFDARFEYTARQTGPD